MSDQELASIEQLAQSLTEVMEELSVWYSTAVKAIFYAEKSISIDSTVFSAKLKQWGDLYCEAYGQDAPDVNRIAMLWKEMGGSFQKLSEGKSAKPSYEEFADFTNIHDEIILILNKISQEQYIRNSGIDQVTKLPMSNNLIMDLLKEQERRARHGKEFTIVIIRVDAYRKFQEQSQELANTSLRYVTKILKAIIRTFDDAYKLSGGRFLLSLKHADTNGALACVERIRTALKGCDNMELLNIVERITLTYGIVEPLPGDDLENVVKSMNDSLDANRDKEDYIVEYQEVSPLQKYIENIDE